MKTFTIFFFIFHHQHFLLAPFLISIFVLKVEICDTEMAWHFRKSSIRLLLGKETKNRKMAKSSSSSCAFMVRCNPILAIKVIIFLYSIKLWIIVLFIHICTILTLHSTSSVPIFSPTSLALTGRASSILLKKYFSVFYIVFHFFLIICHHFSVFINITRPYWTPPRHSGKSSENQKLCILEIL